MSLHHDRLNKRRWRALRRRALDRDGWRCVKCSKAGRLECDHIVRLEDGGERFDPENIQTLCRGCHINKNAGEIATPEPADVREWREFMEARA